MGRYYKIQGSSPLEQTLENMLAVMYDPFKDNPQDEPDVVCKGKIHIYKSDKDKKITFVRFFEAGASGVFSDMYLTKDEFYISPDAYKKPKSVKTRGGNSVIITL